jgi:hypothetical protein
MECGGYESREGGTDEMFAERRHGEGVSTDEHTAITRIAEAAATSGRRTDPFRTNCQAVLVVALLCMGACAPSETQVISEHRTAPLDLSALHSTGVAAMSSSLDPPQKAAITGFCADIGADIAIRLHNYFRLSQRFSLFVCPLIALAIGGMLALVYWKVLARRRWLGWRPLLLCVLVAWSIGGLIAIEVHRLWVRPALASAVAAHRSLFTLAQEGWIPKSTDDTQRDFSANCSDRIADIIQGAREGHDGLKRYPTLFRPAEALPAEDANSALHWAVIQSRAKDLVDLYAVDSGFGKTQARALSWSGVIAQNARFDAATESQGGWWIHSSLHPMGSLAIAVGTPLFAWLFLWLASARVRATVARTIERYSMNKDK